MSQMRSRTGEIERHRSVGAVSAEAVREVCGTHVFRRLIRAFGGRVLRVPAREPIDRDAVREVLDCRCPDETHHSYTAAARRFGVSRQTIVRIGKEAQ